VSSDGGRALFSDVVRETFDVHGTVANGGGAAHRVPVSVRIDGSGFSSSAVRRAGERRKVDAKAD